MCSGVYRILNTIDNKYYVGSSINIEKRWKEHIRSLNCNTHHSIWLQRSWNKYGCKHFIFEILEECEPIKDTLLFIEQKYLDLKPDYNTCLTAGSPFGYKHTQETKEKYFKTRIGNKNPNYGNKYSLETREILSGILRNRVIKETTKEKHRNNLLNSNRIKELSKPIYMLDINTGEFIKEFNSISQAALYTGSIKHRTNIKRVLKGKQYKAYGYKWSYKNDI